jgi:hypothetical protein
MSESVGEKWYTVKQFACTFGQNQFTGLPDVVGVDTVQRWIKRGELAAFQFPLRARRGVRVYTVRMISETERQRFIKANMTILAPRPVRSVKFQKVVRMLAG